VAFSVNDYAFSSSVEKSALLLGPKARPIPAEGAALGGQGAKTGRAEGPIYVLAANIWAPSRSSVAPPELRR